VNAVSEIDSVEAIEVRLQSNEVLVSIPTDTPFGAVPSAIFDAGFKPDETVWLTAKGKWTEDGFLPEGWEVAIPAEKPADSNNALWEIRLDEQGERWTVKEVKTVKAIPQITDERS